MAHDTQYCNFRYIFGTAYSVNTDASEISPERSDFVNYGKAIVDIVEGAICVNRRLASQELGTYGSLQTRPYFES